MLGYKGLYCTRVDVLAIPIRKIYSTRLVDLYRKIILSKVEEIFLASTFIALFPSYIAIIMGGPFMLHQHIHGDRYVRQNTNNIYIPIFDNAHWHLIIVSMRDKTMI